MADTEELPTPRQQSDNPPPAANEDDAPASALDALRAAVSEAEDFFPRQRRTRAAMLAIGSALIFITGVMLSAPVQRRQIGLIFAALGVLCFALDRILLPTAPGKEVA